MDLFKKYLLSIYMAATGLSGTEPRSPALGAQYHSNWIMGGVVPPAIPSVSLVSEFPLFVRTSVTVDDGPP